MTKNRLKQKEIVMKKYPELVREKKKTLCEVCDSYSKTLGTCDYALLPVTTTGEDCPYYQKFKGE